MPEFAELLKGYERFRKNGMFVAGDKSNGKSSGKNRTKGSIWPR